MQVDQNKLNRVLEDKEVPLAFQQNSGSYDNFVKSKSNGKLKWLLVSLSIVGIVIGGGYYFYANQSKQVEIAEVGNAGSCKSKTSRSSCNGTCVDNGAYGGRGELCKWVGDKCVNAGKPCSGDVDDPPPVEINTKSGCEKYGGIWCVRCDGFCNMTKDKGCAVLAEAKCGDGQDKGVSCTTSKDSTHWFSCSCSGGTYYFDKYGACNDENETYDLCWVADNGRCSGGDNNNDGDGSSCPGINGEPTVSFWCPGENWQRDPSVGGCTQNRGGLPAGVSYRLDTNTKTCSIVGRFCGAVQIDDNNGHSISKIDNYNCNPSPTPPDVVPTLACTSLTKDVAIPKLGDELTFTCTGSVVPAGATSLSYSFRYRRNNSEWFDLTGVGDKTSFTVALPGDYEVQCRVCGQINNATVCDPRWIGVTP